jgi:REP element-mobilizing transposase RayT
VGVQVQNVHLLVRGESEASDCKEFIKRAKQYSAFYYSKAHGRKLWQRYGHDHVLRDDERTEDVVGYILLNPIRAGLCERIEDYPFARATVSGGVRL